MSERSLLHSARLIAPLAWPVFVGQVAVLAFSTVDTVMVARYGALDLAALAVGGAAYITIFVGLMGAVLAISPIAGQLFGARKLREAGAQLHQAVWLALGLSVLGCTALLFPQPFLALAHSTPEVSDKVRHYLLGLAFALPPALVFTAFRGFNTAVSRPKIVMLLQLGGLALKVPLNAWFIHGLGWGTPGCGVATAITMWVQLLVAWWVLRRDPFYAPFALQVNRLDRPHRASLRELLRLGVPMGLSIMVEVTGFTFMAIFISRIGTTAVAGHQLAVNLVSMMFMMPLSIANASATLVAQGVGANDLQGAHRMSWHSLLIGMGIASVLGSVVYLAREPVLGIYTRNAEVIATAMPLLAWVALFHIADAGQTVAAFVLRAYRVATAPMVIYVVALWGVGLGGGYTLAFNLTGQSPPALQSALGFWAASTVGLVVAATALSAFLLWMLRQQRA